MNLREGKMCRDYTMLCTITPCRQLHKHNKMRLLPAFEDRCNELLVVFASFCLATAALAK